ncbi:NifU-like protein [Metarhizium album ARSEF 1941]|uniref:NifU-like protein n=1 Tax=Metarhizium album (strain ARSEF 1941) TaxID=1081103 RepID=A0A0B2WQE8_METAS|nr:NifU-like protein [Metarhizium album ARSEF 1941]KHN95864.1 NifU-like protein [Metarhizium album ARSEF 1941]
MSALPCSAAPSLISRALRSSRPSPRWTRLLSTRAAGISPPSRAGLPTAVPSRPVIRLRGALPGPAAGATRSIFIQTENTPNPDALKFLPDHRVVPDNVNAPFIEYLNPRSTISPPYPSALAAKLMNIDGVRSVFYGADFITVTKAGDANWAHVRPEIFALITEAVTSGEAIVSVAERKEGDGNVEEDSLAYNEDDSEVVGMIKELLETRIRPAIQEDGGDIDFRGFEDGYVKLKLRGACRTCDSSTVTLKNGIEGMLMHYIEEVKGVHQILDQEEEIAMEEFAKFEEKLKHHKAAHAQQV